MCLRSVISRELTITPRRGVRTADSYPLLPKPATIHPYVDTETQRNRYSSPFALHRQKSPTPSKYRRGEQARRRFCPPTRRVHIRARARLTDSRILSFHPH